MKYLIEKDHKWQTSKRAAQQRTDVGERTTNEGRTGTTREWQIEIQVVLGGLGETINIKQGPCSRRGGGAGKKE